MCCLRTLCAISSDDTDTKNIFFWAMIIGNIFIGFRVEKLVFEYGDRDCKFSHHMDACLFTCGNGQHNPSHHI